VQIVIVYYHDDLRYLFCNNVCLPVSVCIMNFFPYHLILLFYLECGYNKRYSKCSYFICELISVRNIALLHVLCSYKKIH
jgi:hypothetical protein